MKTELETMTRIEMEDKISRRIHDLSRANGWAETPEIVKNCTHQQTEVDLGSCVRQVTCAECGFTYKYDSGDCGS